MKKLEDLLALENPTLAELEESQKLLHDVCSDAAAEIHALNEEDRARASDRLQNKDDGCAGREKAKARAEKRIEDANVVLETVRTKIAAIHAQSDAEKNRQAWERVRNLLAQRRQSIERIEGLSSEIARELGAAVDAWRLAIKEVPGGVPASVLAYVPTHNPANLGQAILTKVNMDLGFPVRSDDIIYLQNALRVEGLAGYITPSEQAILGGDR